MVQANIYARLRAVEHAMREEGMEDFTVDAFVSRIYERHPDIDDELGEHQLPHYLAGMMRHYISEFHTVEEILPRVGRRARYRFVD